MLGYIARRLLIMVPTLLVISFLIFVIIQAPPGDYLSGIVAECQSRGETGCADKVEMLRRVYHLDQPFIADSRSSTSCRSRRWSATGCG
jgi:peptide/nickel transport system permease protein